MKKLVFAILMVWLFPINTGADIIFFKDGMKTICHDRAWEENDQIKCEYDGAILIYQKKDVVRLEKINTQKEIEATAPQKEVLPKSAAKPIIQKRRIKQPDPQRNPPELEKKPRTASTNRSQPVTNGQKFYNPRRPKKYWTDATSKYNTFQEAIAALAKQYDRSPEWIQHHMGETNDLYQIHQNLQDSQTNAPSEIQSDDSEAASEILFYNPRRPQKYWTSKTAKHHTFKEAISALAKEYHRSQEWIQQHMGKTNNLSEIHQNLANSQLEESSP